MCWLGDVAFHESRRLRLFLGSGCERDKKMPSSLKRMRMPSIVLWMPPLGSLHRSAFVVLVLACAIYWFSAPLLSLTGRLLVRSAQHNMESERKWIGLLGDSITQQSYDPALLGWSATLSAKYVRSADVYNRGMSGYNTKWALLALPKLFRGLPKSPDPMFFTVFLGANDAALPEFGQQHIPLDEYRVNLKKIIDSLRETYEGTRIILIAPPPVDEAKYAAHCQANYGLKRSTRELAFTGKYAAVVVEIAEELDLPVIDLWTEMQRDYPYSWADMLNDGLHLSPSGNAYVAVRILELISERYPDIDPDAVKWDLPAHREIDPNNPELSFAD